MKQKRLLFYFIIMNSFFYILAYKSALTFDPGNDRFGDQLMTYIRAKKLSKNYGVPFLVPFFLYADQLELSRYENMCDFKKKIPPAQYIHLKKAPKILQNKLNSLFVVPFDVEVPQWTSFDDMYHDCRHDTQFTQELKRLIKPLELVEPIIIPDNVYASVAVHVRKGGDFDPPLLQETNKDNRKNYKIFADKIWPTKFPPDEFYLEQIRFISCMVSDRPLYIHIFTDDKNPKAIAEKYKAALNKDNIMFGFREKENHYNAHIIEDLINMASFDYLIRPQSSYSRVAQLIGDHQLILSPTHAHWKREKLIIDKVSRVGPHE